MGEESISWIYHERQQQALCGQHSLNNLLQGAKFTTQQLRAEAQELDQIELAMYGPPGSPAYLQRMKEGSSNYSPSGYFSLQVLQRALGGFPSGSIELTNIVDEQIRNREPTEFEGFICHREDHWFAIRKINGRFWNLNSFLPKPETISHFKLASEIANLRSKAYMVFVALPPNWRDGGLLPAVTMKRSQLPVNLRKYFWNCNILLADEKKLGHKGNIDYNNKQNYSFDDRESKVVKDKANATQDPWMDVGKGKTLADMNKGREKGVEYYVPLADYESLVVAEVKGGGSKMQLRLPQNKKQVKIFSNEDTIAHIYKAVYDLCSNKPPGKNLQLSSGYPPKVLAEGSLKIGEAKLSGASIQCKWI